MTTNGMSKMNVEVSVDQVKKEGCLLWAKIRGYSYWPGIVTVDPMDGLTISESSKTPKVHVHFLGYSNMRGWVELSNILQYEGKASYDQMAAKCSKSRHKDFFPTKKYQRLFDKAAQKAEEVMQIPQEKRLKSLGLIYVLVDNDDNNSNGSSANSNATPLPKITTGVGFFKSYQPPPEPPKPLEKTLDIFDFDDFEDIPSSPFAGPASADKKSENPEAEVVVKSKSTPKLELQKTKKEKTTKRKSSTPLVSSPLKGTSKLVKKSSSAATAKSVPSKKVKVSLENDQASLMIEDLKENDDFTDNPILGSLVWGRMSGFPYWPCFVTRSPVSGEMSRTYGKREETHAQFFNWNNESGWIQSLLPWCSMNEYHSRAKTACPKGANSAEFRNWYPPARLLARWKGAIAQAQKTENMSRKERHSSLVVNYPAARGKTSSKKTTKATATPKKTEVVEEEAETLATEENDDKAVDKACPASKKNIVFKNGLSLG